MHTPPRQPVSRRAQPYVIAEAENFTKVPHSVTEALQREDFTSWQMRILVTILRETLGWGREYAELSAKDFTKKTGIATSHIFITLRDLEAHGAIIRRLNGKNAKNSYALNRNFFAKYAPKRVPPAPAPSTNSVPSTDLVPSTGSEANISSDPMRRTQHDSGAVDQDLNYRNIKAIASGKKDSKKIESSTLLRANSCYF